MATNGDTAWWKSISNQLLLALLGFLFWWLQDMARGNREGLVILQREQHECRRELTDTMFRVKNLETRLDSMRAYFIRRIPQPKEFGEGFTPMDP